jgi:hypothetical protein
MKREPSIVIVVVNPEVSFQYFLQRLTDITFHQNKFTEIAIDTASRKEEISPQKTFNNFLFPP